MSISSLNERDLTLLRHIASGKSHKQVVDIMGYASCNVVYVAVHRARKRLGAKTIYQAVAMVAAFDAVNSFA